MENWVRQRDFMARIASRSAKLPIGEHPFSMDIRATRRRFWRAQVLANIQQIDPSAVAKIPFGMRIVLHLSLRIYVRTPCIQDPLLQCEPVRSQRELGGHSHRPGKEPLCCEANRFPVDRA